VNTKRPIIQFFAQHLPDYRFNAEKRPNLVFERFQPNGIYRCISVQRDGPSCGLCIVVAATYSACWRGEPAYPLGIDTGLANLRLGSEAIDVMQHWHFYEPTPGGLDRTLTEIHRQFVKLVPPFYEQAEHRLLSRRILQLALAESRSISARERVGLEEAHKYQGGDQIEHPAFVRLRDRLRTAWPQISQEERDGTSLLAYEILVYTTA
jgi:hypothetical protein